MTSTVTGTGIAASGTARILQPGERSGYAALGQADFLRLMTAQLQQQDPTSPVDSKEMLAQLAQFQSLGGLNDINQTLQAIARKLDAVLAAQAAAQTPKTPA
jgi:flagellar basal-body rod modification protein FlgD